MYFGDKSRSDYHRNGRFPTTGNVSNTYVLTNAPSERPIKVDEIRLISNWHRLLRPIVKLN